MSEENLECRFAWIVNCLPGTLLPVKYRTTTTKRAKKKQQKCSVFKIESSLSRRVSKLLMVFLWRATDQYSDPSLLINKQFMFHNSSNYV